MTHSRSRSGSRDRARPPFPAFIIRLDVHNLSTTVTPFDLFSILPPHVEPLAVDFSHETMSVSVSARFSFHALEPALVLWNHARHLHAGGYLAHLEASGGESLWFDIDPPIERLVFHFEASKTIFRVVPKDLDPFIHISNLNLNTSADDIHGLIPSHLQPHTVRVHMHSMGPSLSPPFPEPDCANRLVGRATVTFDCMDNAMAMFKHLQVIRQAGKLNRLRHLGANAPFGLNPQWLYLSTQARAESGDGLLQGLLMAAMREPKPPTASRSTLANIPAPAPSTSSSSTRSKTPSPARTRALPPPSHVLHVGASSPSTSSLGQRGSSPNNISTRRPPQPSPMELYADSARPFIPRHYVVCLENISPHAPGEFFDSIAASFPGAPPFHTLVSREAFNITLAFERVATRSVDYSFHSAQDADGFVQYVRGMDKRGEMDEWKAVRGCRVSIYQKTAEGSATVGW